MSFALSGSFHYSQRTMHLDDFDSRRRKIGDVLALLPRLLPSLYRDLAHCEKAEWSFHQCFIPKKAKENPLSDRRFPNPSTFVHHDSLYVIYHCICRGSIPSMTFFYTRETHCST